MTAAPQGQVLQKEGLHSLHLHNPSLLHPANVLKMVPGVGGAGSGRGISHCPLQAPHPKLRSFLVTWCYPWSSHCPDYPSRHRPRPLFRFWSSHWPAAGPPPSPRCLFALHVGLQLQKFHDQALVCYAMTENFLIVRDRSKVAEERRGRPWLTPATSRNPPGQPPLVPGPSYLTSMAPGGRVAEKAPPNSG